MSVFGNIWRGRCQVEVYIHLYLVTLEGIPSIDRPNKPPTGSTPRVRGLWSCLGSKSAGHSTEAAFAWLSSKNDSSSKPTGGGEANLFCRFRRRFRWKQTQILRPGFGSDGCMNEDEVSSISGVLCQFMNGP